MAGAGVIVVLFTIWVGKSAWKKPNAGARLAALLGVVIACWFVLAVAVPTAGGTIAVDSAKGIAALAVGIGKILATF